MIRGGRKSFDANDTLQNDRCFRIVCRGRNYSGAVNEVDPPRHRDVLPDFSFTRYRGHTADLTAFEGVNNTAFPNVGIADETNGDLLLVRVQLGELTEKLDEGAFSKRMVRRCVERDGRIAGGKVLNVAGLGVSQLRLS